MRGSEDIDLFRVTYFQVMISYFYTAQPMPVNYVMDDWKGLSNSSNWVSPVTFCNIVERLQLKEFPLVLTEITGVT